MRSVICIGESVRHLKDPVYYKLLFKQSVDLRAGQGHRDQAVAERLHCKGFAVGHLAVRFNSAGQVSQDSRECRPDS